MRGWMQNFCDIVKRHWWRLVGVGCGFKIYRCERCDNLLEEHE
jgi:hypothetical protein